MLTEFKTTGMEVKMAPGDTGEFEGYGSIFGNVDTYGDLVKAGAFAASILEHKSAGTRPAMHINHGLPVLGGIRGVGVWTDFSEDTKGLHCKGKLSGMNTDAGRMRAEQVKDGAYPGLSIGYQVPTGGAEVGLKSAGLTAGLKRTLIRLNLREVSIVDDPANANATITAFKAANLSDGVTVDSDKAANAIVEAMRLHDRMMSGSYYDSDYSSSSNTKNRAILMNHLRDAHEALTGSRAPADLVAWKSDLSVLAINEFKIKLVSELGLSEDEAKAKLAAWFATDVKSVNDETPFASLRAAIEAL
jgi:hypothetical protein